MKRATYRPTHRMPLDLCAVRGGDAIVIGYPPAKENPQPGSIAIGYPPAKEAPQPGAIGAR